MPVAKNENRKIESLLRELKRTLVRLNRDAASKKLEAPPDVLSALGLTFACLELCLAKSVAKKEKTYRRGDTMPSPPPSSRFMDLPVYDQLSSLLAEAGIRPHPQTDLTPFLDWWQHGRGGNHPHMFRYRPATLGGFAEGMYCENCGQSWDGKGTYPEGPCIVAKTALFE